jgi:hypothetical protein
MDTRYVTIRMNVWYDPGTKRIHLSHNQKDVPPIHTNVRPGSTMEKQFVRLLEHLGKPTGEAGKRL